MKRILPVIFAIIFLLAVSGLATSKTMPSEAVKDFVSRCTLLTEVKHDNLTVIPVSAPERTADSRLLTLDEAMKEGTLLVKEVSESGNVNSLAVWNESKHYIYIMAGEILAGSKQDRVLKEDVLLPPDSGKVIVNVYCVERGRWTYKSDKFYSGEMAANISVRQSARDQKSQSAVWSEVSKTNQSLGAAAPTESLSRSIDGEKVKKERALYAGRLKDLPSRYPKANGVIVLINGKVLVADLFSSRAMFQKLWPKLSDSYVLEAISRKDSQVSSKFTSPRTFLNEIKGSTIKYSNGAGAGQNVEITSPGVVGSGIVHLGLPLHMEVFPRSDEPVVKPTPGIRRDYNNINAPNNPQQQIGPMND
jgi:hypothetical protein